MSALRSAAAVLLWPAAVVGGVAGVRAAVAAGVAAPLALTALQALVVVLSVALERASPEHRRWAVPRGDTRADLAHAVVSGVLVTGIVRLAVFYATPSLGLWPSSWPTLAQFALALALADLGSYGTHLVCHRVRWLWPIHAVHHAAERLYWLNSARMHPLDSALTVLFSLLPLALLGVPARVLVLLDAFVVVHIMLQHANVRMRLGWLNAVIAGPEFHRWHHSPQREEGETNYASFFSLWDRFFGTFRMPPGALAPEVVGLYNGAAMARSWRAQVLHPFRAWRAPAPP